MRVPTRFCTLAYAPLVCSTREALRGCAISGFACKPLKSGPSAMHREPSNGAGSSQNKHASAGVLYVPLRSLLGLPGGVGAAAVGGHNKKRTETPHRLNTTQQFLKDLLTQRMQSGRMPTTPRPPASPPCTILFSACPRFVLVVFTKCNLLVIVLFTWPVARYRSQGVSIRAAKSAGQRLLAANAKPVARRVCGTFQATVAAALYVPLRRSTEVSGPLAWGGATKLQNDRRRPTRATATAARQSFCLPPDYSPTSSAQAFRIFSSRKLHSSSKRLH